MTGIKQLKRGSILTFFELNSTLIHFDPVRNWLLNHETYSMFFAAEEFREKTMESNRVLCRSVYQLVKYLKGEQSECVKQNTKCATRFPFRLFFDFRLDGSLCYILGEMFAFKQEKEWNFFDLECYAKWKDTIMLLTRIEKCLIDKSLFLIPRILFAPEISEELREELSLIVKQNRGVVVDSEALASHVVHTEKKTVHNLNERNDSLARVLFSSENVCLINHLFKPESQLECIENFDIPVQIDANFNINSEQTVAKFHIDLTWLKAVQLCNEWLPEIDFLTESENSEELISISTKVFSHSVNRLPNSTVEFEVNKLNKSILMERFLSCESSEDPTIHLPNPPAPNLVRNLEVNSPGMHMPQSSELLDLDCEPSKAKRAKISSSKSSSNFTSHNLHILTPAYSSWFDYQAINPIELQTFPELFTCFDPSESIEAAKKYLYLRNSIIDKFRSNPLSYLTLKDACKTIPTETSLAVFKLHSFLQRWGLINYNCAPEINSHAHTTQNSMDRSTCHVFGEIENQLVEVENPDVNDQSITFEVKPKIETVQTDTNLKASLRIANFDTESTQVSGSSKKDFGLDLEASKGKDGCGKYSSTSYWNETDLFLLLEGIQIYEEDWDKISEHVGTKNAQQCITQFLKLPIEEPFVSGIKTSNLDAKFDPVPFVNSPNPVMTTIAFLAREVDSRLASEAAKGALDALSRLATKKVLSAVHEDTPMTSSRSEGHASSVCSELEHEEIVSSSAASVNQDFSDDTSCNKENVDMSVSRGTDSLNELGNDEDSSVNNLVPTMNTLREAIDDYERMVVDAEFNAEDQENDGEMQLHHGFLSCEQMEAIHNTPIDKQMSLLATEAALKFSAEKARQLMSLVERRIRVAIVSLVETQLKKVELKMKHFEELEAVLEKERADYEAKRDLVLEEKRAVLLEQEELMRQLNPNFQQQQPLQFFVNGTEEPNFNPGSVMSMEIEMPTPINVTSNN